MPIFFDKSFVVAIISEAGNTIIDSFMKLTFKSYVLAEDIKNHQVIYDLPHKTNKPKTYQVYRLFQDGNYGDANDANLMRFIEWFIKKYNRLT